MDKFEKLVKSIMADAEKEGEPLTREEAEEVAEMELKAQKVKNYVRSASPKAENTPKKSRTTKVSAEKTQLFNDILSFLNKNYQNVEILKENKLIFVQIADKKFKLDLIQSRN